MQKIAILISTLACIILNICAVNCQSFSSIESIEYDPVNEQFLVSNGNSIIAQDYPNGALSFFGMATASHAMEVMDDTLFVISGSRIKGYALSDSEEVMNLNITGASFLNGMTNDGMGHLYATDFGARQIVKIDVTDINNPSFEILVDNTQAQPNGIHYDGENNRLIFVSWGAGSNVFAIDLADNELSLLKATSYVNMDGIVKDSEGNYYISTWSPARIIKFDNNFENDPIEIDLPEAITNPADIGIDTVNNILAIPHYPNSGDEVLYIDLNGGTGVTSKNLAFQIGLQVSISPNPTHGQSVLHFELEQASPIDISLVSAAGTLLRTYTSHIYPAGKHEITLNEDRISSGVYFVVIRSGDQVQSNSFIVH